jgi:excisionase family DNA binding protein
MGFEFFTMDEVAARVHISRRYLEQRVAAGTGPETLHVGRRVLVRSDAFARWVEGLSQSQRKDATIEVEAATA